MEEEDMSSNLRDPAAGKDHLPESSGATVVNGVMDNNLQLTAGDQPGEDQLEPDAGYPGRLLQQAAIFNNAELMDSLLQGAERLEIDAQDLYGRTALYTCVTNDSYECSELLLCNGADVNIAGGLQCGGMTALHVAALGNKVRFVRLLLEHNADLNRLDASGERPLDLAQRYKSFDCVDIIEQKLEAEQNLKTMLRKELVTACMRGEVAMARDISLSPYMPPAELTDILNSSQQDNQSLLYYACNAGNVELCDFLLRKGAELAVSSASGYSPLHVACLLGHKGCVRAILLHDPSQLSIASADGSLPLHLACLMGNLDLARLLLNLSLPASPATNNSAIGSGNPTSSSNPTGSGNPAGISFINAKDGISGRTPLHIATANNHLDLVSLLLAAKPIALLSPDGNRQAASGKEAISGAADVEAVDVDGCTPLHLAILGDGNSAYRDIAGMLLRHRADTNKPMRLEESAALHSPLMRAATKMDLELVDMLLNHGAEDVGGKVMAGAVLSRDYAMVEVMLKYRVHPDTELRVNHLSVLHEQYVSRGIAANSAGDRGETSPIDEPDLMTSSGRSGTFSGSSSCPAVMVNWHSLGLDRLRIAWLLRACLHQLRRCTAAAPGSTVGEWVSVGSAMALHAVTRLDLSGNALCVLPGYVLQLPSLRVLNVACNQIRGVDRCTSNIFRTNFCARDEPSPRRILDDFDQSGDDFVLNSPHLEEINLQRNTLPSLPVVLFQLPALKRLNVSHNRVATVPVEAWSCRSLEELDLSFNQISAVDCGAGEPVYAKQRVATGSIGSAAAGAESPFLCQSLPGTPRRNARRSESDDLFGFAASGNAAANAASTETLSPSAVATVESAVYVESVPLDVGQWLDGVEISAVVYDQSHAGAAFDNRRSPLRELNLSNNRLEEMPVGLSCVAPALEKLSLAYNGLSAFGPIESYPAGLKSLDLSFNRLSSEVGGLTGGVSKMDGGKATPRLVIGGEGGGVVFLCYSPALARSSHSASPTLRQLPLSSRSPTPAAIFSQSLSSLSSPASVPPAIWCPAPCAHRSHHHLEKLKLLKLNNNRLRRFPLSAEVEPSGSDAVVAAGADAAAATLSRGRDSSPMALRKMQKILQKKRHSLQTDHASADPRRGSRSCAEDLFYPSLTLLDLSQNEIVALPRQISELAQLAELKISHNALKELPPELGQMKKLWYLDFRGCPVDGVMHSLLGEKAKKTVAVLGYLKSIKDEATPFNILKLMFVGIQGIGKTSLLHQMRGDKQKYTHWAQRMGHDTKDKDQHGENISTVGVDIGDFEICRNGQKVVFRTWDFGGQKEYYATHQYFLSKRSLYLVVWRVTDGVKGVNDILRWLINIQARAPNSPVIIVGTHRDLVTRRSHPASYLADLASLIESRYIAVDDPQKLGLPRVMGHVEVSCKRGGGGLMGGGKTYVSALVDLIWKVVCEETLPGSHGMRLLDQKVPAIYLQLQQVVGLIAAERKRLGKDPVLYADQYKSTVMWLMEERFRTSFQDVAELSQATQFLHENGILLHYDDVSLQSIYFLDPQWLCDMLASVITIREINSLAKSGVMRFQDLNLLFKGIAFKSDTSDDIKTYIVNLLQKFEVALLWDKDSLLLPSLLPCEADAMSGLPGTEVNIPVKGAPRSTLSSRRTKHVVKTNVVLGDQSTFYIGTATAPKSSSQSERAILVSDQSDVAAKTPSQSERVIPVSDQLDVAAKTPNESNSPLIQLGDVICDDGQAENSLDHLNCTEKSSSVSNVVNDSSGDTNLVTMKSFDGPDHSPLKFPACGVVTKRILENYLKESDSSSQPSRVSNIPTVYAAEDNVSAFSNSHQPVGLKPSPVSVQTGPVSRGVSRMEVTSHANPAVAVIRLYVMSYFPCGFWPRLISRLLGDDSFYALATSIYDLDAIDGDLTSGTVPEASTSQAGSSPDLPRRRVPDDAPAWRCWQTGLELRLFGSTTILRLMESSDGSVARQRGGASLVDYYEDCDLAVGGQDGEAGWAPIVLRGMSILEILVPNEALTVTENRGDGNWARRPAGMVYPRNGAVAALLAKAVDRVDTLLEDWYPDLGVRFTQNTRGMYLITRLVLCPRCLTAKRESAAGRRPTLNDEWVDVSAGEGLFPRTPQGGGTADERVSPRTPLGGGVAGSEQNGAGKHWCTDCPFCNQAPPTSTSDQSGSLESSVDAGVSQPNDFLPTLESDRLSEAVRQPPESAADDAAVERATAACSQVYCYTVEQCLQAAQLGRIVYCPKHGNLGPFFVASACGLIHSAHVAPDSVFQDIGEDRVIDEETITRGKFLGRGAFGAVYGGTMRHRSTGERIPVALKMLQPVKPSNDANHTQIQQHKVEKQKWDKDPLKNSCEAYLNARKELGIMLTLSHPHIVPLLGLCLVPLSLVLSLAPRGALNDRLREYRRDGASLAAGVMRDIVVQVASALAYLHSLQIIYRDVKSENVLVWALPPPHAPSPSAAPGAPPAVDVRLADYGVSRVVLPAGTKGFAGTLPFMAPEIIQHNGEEAYTEKVDCFSFGMFIYELLLLKIPYEGTRTLGGSNINLKGHVLSGGRPSITNRELQYSTGVLDLMTRCWARDPGERPSADQIVGFASRAEFTALHGAVRLESGLEVVCACAVQRFITNAEIFDDMDLSDSMADAPQTDVWVAVSQSAESGFCPPSKSYTRSDSLPSSGSLLVYTYRDQQCTSLKRLHAALEQVTCVCATSTDIWCATVDWQIHLFSLSDYRSISVFSVKSASNGASVKTMVYCRPEDQVYVVLSSGGFVVCDGSRPAMTSVEGSRGSPVQMICPGNGKPVHCVAALTVASYSELWCGQARGRVSVWNLDRTAGSTQTLGHCAAEDCRGDTVHLVATAVQCSASETWSTEPFVWSYVYPGSIVYRWNAATKTITGTIDMLCTLPDTIQKSTAEKHQVSQCQVTRLSEIGRHLYVGTTSGALAVFDRATLSLLARCQPHAQLSGTGRIVPNISAILPLWLRDTSDDLLEISRTGFVTLGQGYNDLVSALLMKGESGGGAAGVIKSRGEVGGVGEGEGERRECVYLLSWSGDSWLSEGS